MGISSEQPATTSAGETENMIDYEKDDDEYSPLDYEYDSDLEYLLPIASRSPPPCVSASTSTGTTYALERIREKAAEHEAEE